MSGLRLPHGSRRRAWCVATLGLALGTAQAAPPLPQRNLSVEMRVADDATDAQQGAAAGGSVRIDSRGGSTVQGGVVVQSRSRTLGQDLQQRVLVLNGGRATLRLAQGQPVDNTEVWWTPWGPAAAVRSQWVELVDGIDVQPRWPGGNAPVTVELAAQRATPAAGGWQGGRPPGPAQWSTLTTVQVPLDEWVTVAQLQSSTRNSAVSTSGFGAATASRQRSLQIRVSLP